MNRSTSKIPYQISEYVNNHFKEDFLFDVKEARNAKGQPVYLVEVTKDDYIHRLRFNEKGSLVEEQANPAFPPDTHEEPGFEDIPE